MLEFLGRFAAERAEGRQRTLEEYRRLYPGHDEAITREYRRLTEDEVREKIGQYRLLRQIGRGGQAVVYLAEDLTIGRKVALKVLLSTLADPTSDHLPARFQREAEALARLDHPGICQVLNAGVSNGTAYIAMRFVPGPTLRSDLEQRAETARPDPARRQGDLVIAEKLARAVSAAHAAGVIHRDLKPGNIILREDDEPVVLDFGIARDLESELSLTRTGDLFGTPHYMSPEQLGAGGGEIDGRTDVWSLGVILHELLTGTRPFDAPTRDGLIHSILHDPLPKPAHTGSQLGRDLRWKPRVPGTPATATRPQRHWRTIWAGSAGASRFWPGRWVAPCACCAGVGATPRWRRVSPRSSWRSASACWRRSACSAPPNNTWPRFAGSPT